ncbi:MAG: hypothetical protein AAGA80_12655 [Cyanobacteria bacterium P01_F01_bin.143]
MNTKNYYVRPGLVVVLSEKKTYEPEELVKLTPEQYKRHAHQVETEAQYQSRNKSGRGKR